MLQAVGCKPYTASLRGLFLYLFSFYESLGHDLCKLAAFREPQAASDFIMLSYMEAPASPHGPWIELLRSRRVREGASEWSR